MKKIILANAFSLNMVEMSYQKDIRITEVAADMVAIEFCHQYEEKINCIGHADTDTIVRGMLIKAYPSCEKNLPLGERKTIVLDESATMYVAQYSGPRLPEGATQLPEGADIKFYAVQILPREAVNLVKAAEAVYKEEVSLQDGEETDVGGWPITGNYILSVSGKNIGGWGPSSRECRIEIGDIDYYN
jgi:hypothetical protein